MTYECDKENVTPFNNRIMERIAVPSNRNAVGFDHEKKNLLR